jgi:hypothetical protein
MRTMLVMQIPDVGEFPEKGKAGELYVAAYVACTLYPVSRRRREERRKTTRR